MRNLLQIRKDAFSFIQKEEELEPMFPSDSPKGKKKTLETFKWSTSHIQSKTSTKKDLQKIVKELDLAIEPSKQLEYYYYKRWIWQVFPWACMSPLKIHKYSDYMKKSYTKDNKGIRSREDDKMTKDALMIIIESKLKKKKILYSKTPFGRGANNSSHLRSGSRHSKIKKSNRRSSSMSRSRLRLRRKQGLDQISHERGSTNIESHKIRRGKAFD